MNYFKSLLKNIDITLLIVAGLFFVVSITMISSTSYDTSFHITREVVVQTIAYLLGIFAMIAVMAINYNSFQNLEKFLYFFSVFILILVFVPGIGKEQYGARGWIDLGPVDFQPSELVKITFILAFAKYLSAHSEELKTFKGFVKAGMYSVPFILIVLIEPDLGNAAVLSFITIGMIFGAGIDYKLFGKIIAAMLVSLPLLYRFMDEHQKIRIDAFLNPSDLSLPGNYQVWNSKVAIGSGGFLGKGLFHGTQKSLKFLPVQESDFIFAVIAEELGFVGGIFVILLYSVFLYRLIKISINAKDYYGSLVVIGILSMFAFQIFENIGMTMGLMPVTGITMPFISYGGSSVLTNFIALGIVLNIGIRSKMINF